MQTEIDAVDFQSYNSNTKRYDLCRATYWDNGHISTETIKYGHVWDVWSKLTVVFSIADIVAGAVIGWIIWK